MSYYPKNPLRNLAARFLESPPITGVAVEIGPDFDLTKHFPQPYSPEELEAATSYLKDGDFFLIFDKTTGGADCTVCPKSEFEFYYRQSGIPLDDTNAQRFIQKRSLWTKNPHK